MAIIIILIIILMFMVNKAGGRVGVACMVWVTDKMVTVCVTLDAAAKLGMALGWKQRATFLLHLVRMQTPQFSYQMIHNYSSISKASTRGRTTI